MERIADFFSKYGFAVFLGVVAIAILFAVGCTIYTAIINPFVGIVGLLGALSSLGVVSWLIYHEIKYDAEI